MIILGIDPGTALLGKGDKAQNKAYSIGVRRYPHHGIGGYSSPFEYHL